MKKVINLLMIGGCLMFLGGQVSQGAEITGKESELTVSLEEAQEPIPGPTPEPTPKLPVTKTPLPQLGEMVGSLIILLSGVSLLIFLIGLYSVKKIVQLDYQEVM